MKKWEWLVVLSLPFVMLLLGLCLGGVPLPITKTMDVLCYKLSGYTFFERVLTEQNINIIWNIRLPRVLLALCIGGALSISGASFQAILRNPLVDPYILGLSSGAAFGAALSMFSGFLPIQISAFIFGLIGAGSSYLLAQKKGELHILRLILAGIMISSVFQALLSLVQFMMEPLKMQGIIYWIMGSLHVANWNRLSYTWWPIVLGSFILMRQRWKLNILSLGDTEAKYLGVHPGKSKALIIIAGTLIASISVAAAGVIGLVGLMIPHLVRMLFSPDNRIVIPVSFALGAAYLVFVDILSRSLFSFEIPIGIFTTLIGAPFFLYLLRKSTKGG